MAIFGRSSEVTTPTGHRTWLFSQLIFLSLLLINLSPVLAITDTSVNPCDFETKFIFCSCNTMDPQEADIINCQLYGRSKATNEEWLAVSNLTSAKSFELIVRPPRILDYALPDIVFSKMEELHYFKVRMAQMDVLPAWAFANSSSLNEISLEDNMISTLSPFSFAYLSNLTAINLAQNHIVEIQREVFVKLNNLTSLVLHHNSIQVIHDAALKDLGALVELELQNNNLSVIAREVFSGLKKLKRLDLRYNLIELLGDHVFAELSSLEDLDLLGNHIVSVSPSAFSGLNQIHRLNLKDNKVVEFFPGTFHHCSKIHFLDLRSNELETFTKDLIAPFYGNFRNLTSIQFMLGGNHFKCDCRILWLQGLWGDTASTSVRKHLNETECEFPQKVYQLRRDEAMRKNIPVILVEDEGDDEDDDDDDDDDTLGTQFIPPKVNVMSLSVEEFNCPPEETTTTTTTTKSPRKGGKKSRKGKPVESEAAEIISDKDLASLHSPDTRTESSSQSHQSDVNVNIPAGSSGSKVNEFLANKWIVLAFLVFLN